jgi:hypothetical protein
LNFTYKRSFWLMVAYARQWFRSQLLGFAVTLPAWIILQERIGYEVKFTLFGIGLTIVCLGLGLLVHGWWRRRRKQDALDQLSVAISQAIRELVNMPRPGPGLVNEEAFADKLAKGVLSLVWKRGSNICR